MSSDLEKSIGYVFSDRRLIDAALTHASLQSRAGNNEKLEFLGDRVLGLVVADMLYRGFPVESEGDLAKRHAALVRQPALAAVAHRIGLPAYIKLAPGEIKAGGLAKDAILADATEALIGAVYLDGGMDSAVLVVRRLWQEMLDADATPPEDAKTKLQEWVQARGLPLPVYTLAGRTGSDHAPMFDIEVTVKGMGSDHATAPSKRQAEKEAAALLLARLEKGIKS